MRLHPLSSLVLCAFVLGPLHAETPALKATVQQHFATEKETLLDLYKHLHSNPELSFHEEKTSARLAEEMRKAGLEVTEKVGGWGVVALLKNGPGKTLLVRTDMDALPVREITGLSFASKVKTKDNEGNEVSVMHACGHDMHMACWVGTARTLAAMKNQWKGTIIFIGQPAEERGGGASAMLKDGLFERFPKPDLCLAQHCAAEIPAGGLGITYGGATASVDSVDIIVHGIGGHGAQPQSTKDPIVLAAQLVLALQTIHSREIHPLEPSVVTVGAIHGGTKHNIISDEVHLQLTVRATSMETRQKILDAIARISRGLGIAAGLPDSLLPEVKPAKEFTPVLHNDEALTNRVTAVLKGIVGPDNFIERKPTMGGEDFSRYGQTDDKIPVCMFWLGATPADKVKAAKANGEPLPSLHSPFFRPDAEPTLATGVTAMSLAALECLK
jgi:hippurate hydrolase